MSGFYSALADGTRLRILGLMADGEVCVARLSELTGESQPKVSRHLAYLRRAGLVKVRRDGKWIFYRLDDTVPPEQRFVFDAVLTWIGARPMKYEKDRPGQNQPRRRRERPVAEMLPELQPEPDQYVDYRPAHNELDAVLL
jgi:ArsR family transcriptional regulator